MGIFEEYRAIGCVTNSVPFSIQRRGTETFVTVSIGKAFQLYNCAKLNLVIVGPQLPKKIRALASYRDYTFAAYGSHIGVFYRAHQVTTWSKHNAKVNHLFVFGEHVISIDVEGNIFMWDSKKITKDQTPVGHILLDHNFSPSCITHPATLLNKVIIGSQQGSLQMWNVNTKEKIHEFKHWKSAICCCVSSPTLDDVAVGCSDGKVHVHKVGKKCDKKIVTFTHSTRGAVTALSFSTGCQERLLASGGSSGVISIWNLDEKRLASVIREAHNDSIVSLHFFAKEPVLISSSADNSIKMWIFDTTDGVPRLLRFRSGHSAPPQCIKFYSNGRHILSAGQDRAFRLFSVMQDQQSRELSQHHITKRARRLKLREEDIKLKQVISFDVAEIRERDWCNVVTCHMNTAQAYVWRLQNFVLGEHILTPCPENPTPVKACAISVCGNSAVLGTAGGWIEQFNLQSGMSKGRYVDLSVSNRRAHDGEVVGIACGYTNDIMASACGSTNAIMVSAGYHGDIKVWDFNTCKLKSRWEVGCSLIKTIYHRINGLLATVADDLVIRLYDVNVSKMVRKFEGHTDRITDMCFSEDGKWLLTSSMDGSLRIWDVISAGLIDVIQVDFCVTALSLSPNMDVLATTHVDQNGVYLWVNQAMFSGSTSANSYGSRKQIVKTNSPSASSAADTQDVDSVKGAVNPPQLQVSSLCSISSQQIPGFVTLSLLPKSQWQSLVSLDIIKARNKPIEPPKKPEKAPFFLPSIHSLSGEIQFQSGEPAIDEKDKDPEETKKNIRKSDSAPSKFWHSLQSAADANNFAAFTEYINSLSPSTVDLELRIIQIINDDDQELDKRPELHYIGLLLDYFIHEISCRNNFEFVQALIRLFFKIHGESIRRQSELQSKAMPLLEVQSAVWQPLNELFNSVNCMLRLHSNSYF